jgi:hypothetical protein
MRLISARSFYLNQEFKGQGIKLITKKVLFYYCKWMIGKYDPGFVWRSSHHDSPKTKHDLGGVQSRLRFAKHVRACCRLCLNHDSPKANHGDSLIKSTKKKRRKRKLVVMKYFFIYFYQ